MFRLPAPKGLVRTKRTMEMSVYEQVTYLLFASLLLHLPASHVFHLLLVFDCFRANINLVLCSFFRETSFV